MGFKGFEEDKLLEDLEPMFLGNVWLLLRAKFDPLVPRRPVLVIFRPSAENSRICIIIIYIYKFNKYIKDIIFHTNKLEKEKEIRKILIKQNTIAPRIKS